MDDLTRFSVLARLVEQEEEPPTSVMPITQIGRRVESGQYRCRGCGKGFKTTADIGRHQMQFCQAFALRIR